MGEGGLSMGGGGTYKGGGGGWVGGGGGGTYLKGGIHGVFGMMIIYERGLYMGVYGININI